MGRLVSDNYRSSIVQAPLIDRDPTSGEPLNYWELSQSLEQTSGRSTSSCPWTKRPTHGQNPYHRFRQNYRRPAGRHYRHLLFAVITLVITSSFCFCTPAAFRGTLTPLLCSVIAVIWQLGLLTTLGYGLNAYSILIPFLVFAIGVSHGVQIINAFLGESIAGKDRLDQARGAFRALYIPGMTALVSDAIGFITMVLIPIQVIKDLGSPPASVWR